MFQVIVVISHLVGGGNFSEAVSYSILSDTAGYTRRLMVYCSKENGEPRSVDADGSEFFKNDRFCTINPNTIFESTEPCGYDNIAKCVKSSVEKTFSADLNDGEFSGPLCVDHENCKLYFNFYDKSNYYLGPDRCGYQFGGIAKFNSQHHVAYYLSISIKPACLSGRR